MGKGSISRWKDNVKDGCQEVRSINELQTSCLDNLDYELKRSFIETNEEAEKILKEAHKIADAKKKR